LKARRVVRAYAKKTMSKRFCPDFVKHPAFGHDSRACSSNGCGIEACQAGNLVVRLIER